MTGFYMYRMFPPLGSDDPGFFLGGGATLRNGVTDWYGKQILKANTKEKVSSQGGGGVRITSTLLLDPPLRSTKS